MSFRRLGRNPFSATCSFQRPSASLGFRTLPPSSKPESRHVSLTPTFSLPLTAFKHRCDDLGPPGQPRIMSHLKVLSLITPAVSLWPNEVTYSQAPKLRTWALWGLLFCLHRPSSNEKGHHGKGQKGQRSHEGSQQDDPSVSRLHCSAPALLLNYNTYS